MPFLAAIPAAVGAIGSAVGAAGAAVAGAVGAVGTAVGGMGAVGAIGSVLGAGVSAYGMIQQGKAQSAQMRHQARVEEVNATQGLYDSVVNESIATANRDEMMWQANEELRGMAKQSSAERATAQAVFSQSGLDLESGSITGILGAQSAEYADQRRGVKANASWQARGFNMQARGARHAGQIALSMGRNQASGLRVGARNARRAGNISGFGTALSGIGQAAGMYGGG